MKPIRRGVVFSTPWFKVVGKTMREGEDPFYSLRLPDYTSIIAITEEERIVIVRQYRPAVERYTLELPSGLVDAGETPAEAAARELLEETGFEAPRVELIGPMETDSGRLGNRIWTCVGRGVRKVNGRMPEEGIEVLEWDLDELHRAIADGRFGHALHVAVVYLAVVRGALTLP